METLKLIIAGSRDWDDYEAIKNIANDIISTLYIEESFHHVEIVCGKAKGADTLGEKFAKEFGYDIKFFPADWKNLNTPNIFIKENRYGLYNANAGKDRNIKMANYANACIVFWNGKSSGSKHMIDTAQLYNLPVFVIAPNGVKI